MTTKYLPVQSERITDLKATVDELERAYFSAKQLLLKELVSEILKQDDIEPMRTVFVGIDDRKAVCATLETIVKQNFDNGNYMHPDLYGYIIHKDGGIGSRLIYMGGYTKTGEML